MANVVRGAQHRITVLDAGLFRLERSDSGRFEDRASQMAVNRAFAPAGHTVAESDTLLQIDTECLHLSYDKGLLGSQLALVRATRAAHRWHSARSR